jgi:hypothetical protein
VIDRLHDASELAVIEPHPVSAAGDRECLGQRAPDPGGRPLTGADNSASVSRVSSRRSPIRRRR